MGPSTRARYGLRALIYICSKAKDKAVSVREISENEDVSADYLEHLLHAMKSAGLVKSIRGASGGFQLAKPPENIRLKEIFTSLDEKFDPVWCLREDEQCSRQEECLSRPLWRKFGVLIDKFLSETTLANAIGE